MFDSFHFVLFWIRVLMRSFICMICKLKYLDVLIKIGLGNDNLDNNVLNNIINRNDNINFLDRYLKGG